jgi:hypothetical protein
MTSSIYDRELAEISSEEELSDNQDSMIERWKQDQPQLSAVDAVLKFMERHPDWDFGTPGALVHFVEKFYGKGYESLLLQSLTRRPTGHTLWMLNRMINGEQNAERKASYVETLSQIASDSRNDEAAIARARRYLSLHTDEGSQ